jgi:FkbM family methyltransferase
MGIENIYTHTVLPNLIGRNSIVLDCGANEGAFSLEMIRRFGCRCYCIEPSPNVFATIPEPSGLFKMNIALCHEERPVELNLCKWSAGTTLMPGAGREGFGESVTVQGRKLEDVVHELNLSRIDLIKMDIEGAEMEVLASCSDAFIKSIDQWTIEFHDFLGYASTKEVSAEIARIKSLGFYELYSSMFRNTEDVLLVNKRAIDAAQYVGEHYLRRNWRGIRRMQRRLFGSLHD